MDDWRRSREIVVLDGRIQVPYTWSAGEVGTSCLEALRDEKKFLGARCPECGIACHVPRMHCPDCFAECERYVELGSAGELVTYQRSCRSDVFAKPGSGHLFAFSYVTRRRSQGADNGKRVLHSREG